jgi:outer membrane protein OmpA-like peptidoglycan-associated protein/uncharacterized protein YidB (DUF937 family)
MFDSIIRDVDETCDLGGKARDLVAAVFGLMTDGADGFSGFIDRFRAAGLGDLADSWVSSGANTPISFEQMESAFGEDTLKGLSEKAGIDYKTTVTAAAYSLPRMVDELTPDGEIPFGEDLRSRAAAFLGGVGTSSGGVGTSSGGVGTSSGGSENIDRVDAGAEEAAALAEKEASSGDGGILGEPLSGGAENPLLSWLLPLLILALLVVLGFWFCGGESEPVATVETNANRANVNQTANTSADSGSLRMTDSSFKIEAKEGKYTISGIVPDQATFDKIKAALGAQFGEANLDFSGLKIDADAKPLAADWWTNFEKMLPDLKGWTNGTLAFSGNAITAASGLPQAAMDKLRSLFSGWKLPSMETVSATDENRALTEVSLPDGTKLQAYPNGIEDQLIKFIQSDEYKNATNDSLKDKWFNFDDLNFEFGTTKLAPESKRQLDNIVAILKAFPDVKIKIGGYTDKKGDDAANKKLSDDRAKAVKAALEKAGVGAQVPEAEGYGEEFATVPETASDEERKVDRKTAVRLLK